MKRQSNSNRDFFERHGYLVIPDLFPAETMDILLARVAAIERREVAFPDQKNLLWEPSDNSVLRNVFGLLHLDPFFRGAALDSCLVDVVTELLGTNLDIYGDGLFAKPAHEGSVVPPHQDMPYWSFRPYKMLTAWIALEDATTENGCLQVIPGSHKLGLLEHKPSNIPGNSKMIADESICDWQTEVPIELVKGSVGFHHCLTVHRSDPNRSNRSRRAYTVVFMTGEAEWIGKRDHKFPFLHVKGQASSAFHAMKHVQIPDTDEGKSDL